MNTRIPGAIARPPTKPPLALLIRLSGRTEPPEPPIVFVTMADVADRVVNVGEST